MTAQTRAMLIEDHQVVAEGFAALVNDQEAIVKARELALVD